MTKRILVLLLFCNLIIANVQANHFSPKLMLQSDWALCLDDLDEVYSDDKLYANEQIEISNLYPNPANDVVKFNYVISDANAKVKITIRNVLGSVVKEEELSHHSRELEIDVHEYASGMYFYSLSINNRSMITKKFLVKR
jgi:hypothetical protein